MRDCVVCCPSGIMEPAGLLETSCGRGRRQRGKGFAWQPTAARSLDKNVSFFWNKTVKFYCFKIVSFLCIEFVLFFDIRKIRANLAF